jgi:penicillin-binding protein 1C
MFAPKANRLVVASALIALLLGFALAFRIHELRPPLPSFESTRKSHTQGSHEFLVDRHGVLLESWRRAGEIGWQAPWRSLDDFPTVLIETVIASEDQRFYQHGGVDGLALAASALQVFGSRRGASTITMQTARLLLGRDELPPTLWGKLRQIDAAWALERNWSKAQILETYLNLAPLRRGVRGFQTGQALWLSGLQSAEQERAWPLLVAMLPAPQASPEMLGKRSCAVMQRWAAQSSSARLTCREHTAAQWAQWQSIWLEIFKQNRALAGIKSAQVAIYSIASDSSSQQLMPPSAATRSTLDARLQRALNRHLLEGLAHMRSGDVNAAAAVLLDNASGEVLAMGSAETPSSRTGSTVDLPVAKTPSLQGIQTKRTLASTLKPFLYAQALDAGLLRTQEIIRIRGRVFRQGTCDLRPYTPRDSFAQFQSQVSPALGLAASSNTAAVDIISRLTPQRFESSLSMLQIIDPPQAATAPCQPLPRYGHALALGAAQGSLLSLTNAYRSLANGGLYNAHRLWLDGAPASQATRVMNEKHTAWVSAALSNPALRFEAFGPRNALNTPYWSASKTGTSDRSLDNWAVGYTRQHSLGVWIGNTKGEPMKGVFGPSGAAPIWRAIMDEAAVMDK